MEILVFILWMIAAISVSCFADWAAMEIRKIGKVRFFFDERDVYGDKHANNRASNILYDMDKLGGCMADLIHDKETTGGFQGEYAFLSNMFPVELQYGGHTFPSSENLYQYLKIDDPEWRQKILEAENGYKAKRITRKKGFPESSKEQRVVAMWIALNEKFKDEEMIHLLLNTAGTKIVEYNTWNDTFWGVCDGVGENRLGKMLMKIRHDLVLRYMRLKC